MNTTITFKFICGILCLIGLCFITTALLLRSSIRKKLSRCTMVTTGTVVRSEKKTSFATTADEVPSTSWYPVYQYYADGRCNEVVSNLGSAKPQFADGTTIELMYDPANPKTIYVPEENPKFLVRLFLLIGIGLILCAIIMTVLQIYL